MSNQEKQLLYIWACHSLPKCTKTRTWIDEDWDKERMFCCFFNYQGGRGIKKLHHGTIIVQSKNHNLLWLFPLITLVLLLFCLPPPTTLQPHHTNLILSLHQIYFKDGVPHPHKENKMAPSKSPKDYKNIYVMLLSLIIRCNIDTS